MELWMLLFIFLFLFVLLLVLFRRYWSALILDYVVDAGFSFADNFIVGAGIVGLDVGDALAAVIIFFKERKITNTFAAFIVAWEALNFLPLGLIPAVGEGIEMFFGFFPAVLIGRILFNKYGDVKQSKQRLKEDWNLAKEEGVYEQSEQSTRKVLNNIDVDLRQENPAAALQKAEHADHEIAKQLIDKIYALMNRTEHIIQTIVQENIDAPPELIDSLQEAINHSESLLSVAQRCIQEKKLKDAMRAAKEANAVIIEAVRAFDAALDTLQNVG